MLTNSAEFSVPLLKNDKSDGEQQRKLQHFTQAEAQLRFPVRLLSSSNINSNRWLSTIDRATPNNRSTLIISRWLIFLFCEVDVRGRGVSPVDKTTPHCSCPQLNRRAIRS